MLILCHKIIINNSQTKVENFIQIEERKYNGLIQYCINIKGIKIAQDILGQSDKLWLTWGLRVELDLINHLKFSWSL